MFSSCLAVLWFGCTYLPSLIPIQCSDPSQSPFPTAMYVPSCIIAKLPCCHHTHLPSSYGLPVLLSLPMTLSLNTVQLFDCTLPRVSVPLWLCLLFSLDHHHARHFASSLSCSLVQISTQGPATDLSLCRTTSCPFGNFCVLGAITSSCSRKPTPSRAIPLLARPSTPSYTGTRQIVRGHHPIDLQPVCCHPPVLFGKSFSEPRPLRRLSQHINSTTLPSTTCMPHSRKGCLLVF